MREYTDLIKYIQVDNSMFVPIHRIAELAFNYSSDMITNDIVSIGCSSTYRTATIIFNHIIGQKDIKCILTIRDNYDISKNFNIRGQDRSDHPYAVSNQVEIFKLLKEWGFIGNG